MVTTTQNKSAGIERGQTNLIIPYHSGELVYVSSQVGRDTYRKVGSEILKQGLLVPIGDYAVPLVHTAYCDEEVKNKPEFRNVRDIVRNQWLWVFNINLWTDKGVYVYQDLEAKGLSEPLDIRKLEKSLKGGKDFNGIRFSEDGRVRFAPKESYVLGDHTPDSLSKDGFMVVSSGKDGAEKLAEVSSKFRYKPKTFGEDVQKGKNPEQTVSTLGEGLGEIDGVASVDRLGFLGDSCGGWGGWVGYAFGVRP